MKYARLTEMEEYILKKDYVSLRELCDTFERSMNTIRRDIAELLQNGTIEKVYGGVRAVKPPSSTLLSYTDRTVKRKQEKECIGKLAAQFVQENDVIFLDSGTTTINLLDNLPPAINLTILTNNLHVISACIGRSQLNVISFGGQLNHYTASFSSNFCDMDFIRSFNINKAFMAATGVSVDRGATNSSPGEYNIKKAIVDSSDCCFLMADFTKFGHCALMTYAELSRFSHVITDRIPSEEFLEYFTRHDTRLFTGEVFNGV